MKKIYEDYEHLVLRMEESYDGIISALKAHISWLEVQLDEYREKDARADLTREIEEYNRLEAQNNTSLEDEIARLKAENSRIKKAKVQVKPPRKFSTKIVKCVDCGAEFHAKTNKKKRCSKCELSHKRSYQRVWVRKKNANASK